MNGLNEEIHIILSGMATGHLDRAGESGAWCSWRAVNERQCIPAGSAADRTPPFLRLAAEARPATSLPTLGWGAERIGSAQSNLHVDSLTSI